MAEKDTQTGGTDSGNQEQKLKDLFKSAAKEAFDEWATEREKTRTETAKKPSLLEGLLNF